MNENIQISNQSIVNRNIVIFQKYHHATRVNAHTDTAYICFWNKNRVTIQEPIVDQEKEISNNGSIYSNLHLINLP